MTYYNHLSKGVAQGRYSFVGAQPVMEVVARENIVTVIDHQTRQRTVTEESDPMEVRVFTTASIHPPTSSRDRCALLSDSSPMSPAHCCQARSLGSRAWLQILLPWHGLHLTVVDTRCSICLLLQQWQTVHGWATWAICREIHTFCSNACRDGTRGSVCAGSCSSQQKLEASNGRGYARCVHWRLGGVLRL